MTDWVATDEVAKQYPSVLKPAEEWITDEIVYHLLNDMAKLGRSKPKRTRLTPREIEILLCYAEGLTAEEVGKKLYLTESTVRSYNREIRKVLNANNVAHSLVIAHRQGFINLSS